MPSPAHRTRTTVASPGHRDSKGAAIRRGDLKISDPIQLPPDFSRGISQRLTMGTLSNPTTTPTPPLEGTWSRKSVPPGVHSTTRSSGANEPQKQRGASPNATSRTFAGASMPNGYLPTGPSKPSLSKQKEGGFRAKMRRMFGSQRLRERTISNGTEVHHSQTDPPNLPSVQSSNSKQPTGTPSQPVSEPARSSALSSYSPKPPKNIEVSPQDLATSKNAEDPVSRHRRRNTLPSATLSFHEVQMLAATLGELGMRPGSKPLLHHSDGELTQNLKRRSRSADRLSDEARSHQMSPIQWRRRSGEIQYWRNSVLENPIPETSGMQHDVYHSRESGRSPFRSFAPLPSSAPRSASRESLNQFQFGSFANVDGHAATIEQRLTTLEVKFVDHEYAIAELQGCEIARPVTATKVPKQRSVQDIFPAPNDLPNPGRTFLSSPADSPTTADDFDHSKRHHRSSNAPTLRPFTDNSPSPNLITTEQYEALLALLATEQAARRKLEEAVAALQTQVDELSNASFLARRPSAYPTPSPESRHSTLAFRGHPTRRTQGFSRSRVGSDETSRFSVTDADDSETEDGFLDTYETPRETQESRFGFESDRRSPTTVMI